MHKTFIGGDVENETPHTPPLHPDRSIPAPPPSSSIRQEPETERDKELQTIEDLVDALKTGAVPDRRDALLDLVGKMAADARIACFAETHGARALLLRGLDAAVRRGDEALMDAVSAALAEHSRAHDKDHKQVELKAVAGSQVGAAAQRPAGVEEVRLPMLGTTLRVHESAWGDAGLAWRIWGAARITAHAIDHANVSHMEVERKRRSLDGGEQMGTERARRKSENFGASPIATSELTFGEEDACGSCDGASSHGDDTHVMNASPHEQHAHSCASTSFVVRGKRVLELGAGCGLCAFACAAAGAKDVVVTEGAPGALAALRRTAEDNEFPEGTRVRVKFLDWRDDQAAEDESGMPIDAAGGNVDCRDGAREKAGSGDVSDSVDIVGSPPVKGGNWVHMLNGGADAARNLDRLDEHERFDLVVGSDLIYDESHAEPLAACLARRIDRRHQHSCAHVTLAVRKGELLDALARAAMRRGLIVGAHAVENFDEEAAVLRVATGGHITRAEPPGVAAWRERCGAQLAAGEGVVLPVGEVDADAMREGLMDLEGRVAMLTFRWPSERSL